MAVVCVVVEHWCNEENNSEDLSQDSKVLAVAGNPSTAENIIAGRKLELINRALDYDSKCSVNDSWPHNSAFCDALRLDFSKYETPFDREYYIFNKIAFYWKIEDHEIES